MNVESSKEMKSKLELFREKVATIKAVEMAKKERCEKELKEVGKAETGYNPHFEDINPNDLTEEDREIYEEFKSGSLTSKKFAEYRENIFSALDIKTNITKEDSAVYEKFKKKEITRDELLDYWQKHVGLKNKSFAPVEFTDSRASFCAWLANQISSGRIWLKKFAEERKK